MRTNQAFVLLSAAAAAVNAASIKAVPVSLSVSSAAGNATSPYQYGLMFEVYLLDAMWTFH